MSRDGRLIIGDFGIARREATDENPNTEKVGTHAYMPLEQFQRGKLGTSADGFSFGIMFIEMLAYLTPFDDIRKRVGDLGLNQTTMAKIENYQSESGKALLSIAKDLCRTSPNDRPNSKAVIERLENWFQDFPLV